MDCLTIPVAFFELHGYTFLWFLSNIEKDNCTTCRYCETLGPVGEEKNAFTGLSFSLIALILSLWCTQNVANFVFLCFYSMLGPGLMVMHLYQSTWAEHIDSMSLVLFLSYYYYHSISAQRKDVATIIALCVLTLCTTLEFTVDAETRGWNVMVWILIVGLMDGVLKRIEYSRMTGTIGFRKWAYWIYSLGQVVFFLGSAMQIAGRFTCDASSPWQFHAAWHIFASFGLALLFVAQDLIRFPRPDYRMLGVQHLM